MKKQVSRRGILKGAGVAVAAGLTGRLASKPARADDAPPAKKANFRFQLNTSTIRGQNLTLPEEIDIAAKAGYDAIEPWLPKIDAYLKGGGSLQDMAKKIKDAGMTVESSIGFAKWIVDDDAERAKGLDHAKRDMEHVAILGAKRIAAPPMGVTDRTDMSLYKIADRYRALAELGAKFGVIPQVELWGFSKTLGRLGEVVMVALESGHPQACVLPDVYHLFKGGSDFGGIKYLSESAFHVFHMNDYPAGMPREKAQDKHRVYPGDGCAPIVPLLKDLRAIGFNGVLSLELFNEDYWKQDALLVAKTGLQKMKDAVKKSAEA